MAAPHHKTGENTCYLLCSQEQGAIERIYLFIIFVYRLKTLIQKKKGVITGVVMRVVVDQLINGDKNGNGVSK
jgi:hypothetical protein